MTGEAGNCRETEAISLLERLGRRVRAARGEAGLSRQALSRVSGVSQRYLAQLEAGLGNISVLRLHRVARALDVSLPWLLRDDAADADVLRMAELFAAADGGVRARVLSALDPGAEDRGRRICLIGLRGAGKSTLGEAAAARLDMTFVELNREIEAGEGMALPEIMALYGTEGFRTLERAALAAVIDREERCIIAVGGGLVGDPGTFALALSRCHTVWIRAEPEEHMRRVRAQGDTRPMAGRPRAMAQLRALLESRTALYAQAEAVLETSGTSVSSAVSRLLDLIARQGWLNDPGRDAGPGQS